MSSLALFHFLTYFYVLMFFFFFDFVIEVSKTDKKIAEEWL